jgi:hypothetical protein
MHAAGQLKRRYEFLDLNDIGGTLDKFFGMEKNFPDV